MIGSFWFFQLFNQNAFGYVLPITSFVVAWLETWFLDFKVLTQEAEDERGEDGGVISYFVKFYKCCKELNIFVIELFIHKVFVIVLQRIWEQLTPRASVLL